jgi:CRISPR-associated protein Cas1
MKGGAFLETCVRDIKQLLTQVEEEDDLIEYGPEAFEAPDVVMLWDNNGRNVPGGTAYGDDQYGDDQYGDDEP